MPRGARLDAPGTLHHVIIHGIERGKIVNDDEDRENFYDRDGRTSPGNRNYNLCLDFVNQSRAYPSPKR